MHTEEEYRALALLANTDPVYEPLAKAACDTAYYVLTVEGLTTSVSLRPTQYTATYFKENVQKRQPKHQITIGGKLIGDYILGKQDLFLSRDLDKIGILVRLAPLTWQEKAAYVILHEIAHAMVFVTGERKPGISHGKVFYEKLEKLLWDWWKETEIRFNENLLKQHSSVVRTRK